MRPILPDRSRQYLRLVLAVALLSLLGTASAADPVEDLQQILFEGEGRAVQNKEEMAAYQKKLEERVRAIQRPSELRRALMLGMLRGDFIAQELGNQPDEVIPLGKAYQKARSDLVKRLQGVLRDSLQAKDSARRLASVTFLAEMADDERVGVPNPGMEQLPSRRFTSSMAADLLAVLSNKDEKPQVRAAAAEAVAAINPNAEKTLEALKKLLDPARDVVERRAAARGLKRMLAILPESHPEAQVVGGPGPRPPGLPASPQARKEGIAQPQDSSPFQKARANLVTAAGLGLIDKKDATVRLLCLETIQQALQTKDQQAEISRPLAMAVNKRIPAVITLLEDADLKVCLAAHQVLEGIAAARWKLHWSGLVPRAEKRRDEGAKLLDGILEALPALKRSLANQKEVRVRLAALYVLETLGDSAEKAVDEIVITMKDKNGFVRWGAVRALNNMAPRQAEKAAPALAGRLSDNNKTVRLAAAQALGRYGSQAKPAVKSLETTIGDSESHVRLAAINALAAIGPDAHPAAGAVVKVLAEKQQKPEVRAAAAQALRRLGPLDAEAKKALTQALEAPNGSVRQAASETLLEKD